MTDRPRLPIPRTLSGTPSPQWRVPAASDYAGRFPALAAVLASGVVIPACHDPVCGATRAEELESHGRSGVRAAGRGDVPDALREIGVALGVVGHGSTRAMAPGETPAVTTTPRPPVVTPPAVVPPTEVDGGMREVTPMPTTPPHRPPNAHPLPPQPTTRPMPTRGRVRHVSPQPPRQRAIEGDIVSVGPQPVGPFTRT
jgi:hypothetical protein